MWTLPTEKSIWIHGDPFKVTLGVFGFKAVAASESNGKCPEWQEEAPVCGQSSNRVVQAGRP